MKATNYFDVPPRLQELWEWFSAVCAYDYGDPNPLADLVRDERPVPTEFAGAIADVIAGTRRPNRKAGAKAKVAPAERMKIAGSLSVVLGLLDLFHRGRVDGDLSAGFIASRDRQETIEIVRSLEEEARRAIAESARELGVNTETVENLLREMRARVRRWPAV